MASTKAAVIRGIFLKPGLSKNRRLYTKDNIGKAVERMKNALASGEGMPLNMATSHAAAFKDDATSTVGRITKVWQNSDGSAAFEADIANTAHGRDVANLTVGKFIKGISIRGAWASDPKAITHYGEEAVTADDLAIDGVDFTNSPGVDGAEIQYAALAESYNSNRSMIFESIDEIEVVEEFKDVVDTEEIIRGAVESALEALEDSKKPYGDVTYADPGYQKDKQKRYPINTAAHVRAAWSYINQADNAHLYTSAQLARIKSRIKSAAKRFGINIVSEANQLAADIQDVLEAYASIALVNDADTINITGYTQDPHLLKTVANRIAFGAIAAMHAIDPDDDGDIYLSKPDWSQVDATGDASGMGPEDENVTSYTPDDNNMECAECGMSLMEDAKFCHGCGTLVPSSPADAGTCGNCGTTAPQDAMYCPTCGDPVPQAESSDNAPTQEMETEVSDENATPVEDEVTAVETPAEEATLETAAARTLSDADLQALAAMIIAARPTESTEPEAVDAEVAPEAEEETVSVEAPAEEIAAEEVATEESTNSQENTVAETTFTVEQVQAMIAEAASKAAVAAVAEAKENAVASYRQGQTTFRKGLTSISTGNDASDLSESEELDPRMLAEMNSTAFRKVQNEAWGNTPFFAAKFAQADRGF